jgi:anti-sigma-K factor RskA
MSLSSDTLIEYALGMLEPPDKEAVEQAVATSPALALELAGWQRSLAVFAQVLPPVAPKSTLEARLRSKIQQTLTAVPQAVPMQATPVVRPTVLPTMRWTLPRMMQFALPAAAVFAALLFGWRSNQLQNRLNALEQNTAARVSVLAQSSAVALVSNNKNPIGQAFVRPDGTVLIALRLPPPPAGKTYQAWFVAPNQQAPQPLATLNQSLDTTIPVGSLALAISLEPVGGSTTPTEVLGVGEVKF